MNNALTSAPPLETDDALDGKRIHPLASVFPPMSDDEFTAICEDVRANGLVEPIVLLDGEILDGIHRLKACLLAGITPRYQDWNDEGGTPMQYVWSRNWTRRHLSAGQRAVISLAAEREFAKEATSRMSHKALVDGVERIPQVVETGKARDLAGQLAGVNPRYVQDAKSLEKVSPALLEEVRLGHLTLPVATRQAKKVAEMPGADKPIHRVRIEFGGHALDSKRLPKADAAALCEGLVSLLEGKEDASVRVIGPGVTQDKKAGKAAFGTKEWAVKNVNFLNGCQHDCVYCYAKSGAIFHGRNTPSDWKMPKVNRDVVSKNWEKRDDGGRIMLPSTHDLHPDNLDDYLTVLRKLLTVGNKVLIVSKPHLVSIERLCREMQAFKSLILFRFTIGSANDAVLRAWEPNAPPFAERAACLRHAYQQGFATSVSCEPMLDDNIHAVIEAVKPYVTDTIWLGRVNNLKWHVGKNRPGDEAARKMADDLVALMSDEYVKNLWARYQADPKIEPKESITKIVGVARSAEKGCDG